uniref:Dual specificity protein phosphatase 19 n=2 Tax=Parascaris univalens TaxID=6257 RepID=A0A915BT27_PARUN
DMSLVERIDEAKRRLNRVETRVTFEDGSVANERRTVDGGFDYVDIVDEVTERANTSNFSSEEQHSANIDRLGGKIAAPIESYPSISNRQLKKRLRRQRLGFVVDLRPDLQMAKITEGVYLGSQDVACDIELITTHNITHIINCASGVRNFFEGRVKYLNIDVFDLPSVNIAQYFNECHAFMRKCIEANGNVLVHCNAGVSRSATIVLSYLMRYEGKSLKEALEQVNSVRRVSPNAGFMQQLLTYEIALKEGSTQ